MNKSIEQLKTYLQQNNIRHVFVLTDANVDELYPHYLDPLSALAQVDKMVVQLKNLLKALNKLLQYGNTFC